MPFFTPDQEAIPSRSPSGVVPPNPIITGDDTLRAAFRQDNPLVNLYGRLNEETFPPEEGHNPLDIIKGTPYEQNHLDNFIASRSAGETRAIMRRIDQEDADRQTLDAAGSFGTIAQIAAGTLSPELALPAGTIYKTARGGYAVARSALSVGVAAAAQTALSEGVLQATQETRTAAESATAISSSIILGSLLGSAAKLLAPAERKSIETMLDRDRVALDTHAGNIPAGTSEIEKVMAGAEPAKPATEAAPGLTAAVGAAASDTRKLNLESSGLGFTAPISPTRRVLAAESIEGRRTMADLAETPYRFEGGETPTQGPALSRIAKMEIDGTKVEVSDAFDKFYADYRFGDADKSFPRARDTFQRYTGQDSALLTFGDFKREIAKALQEGDQHTIPQVASAAQLVRKRVFDPWKERAIAAGLLPEDVGVKTAESYFTRLYNKQLINARRPEFVDRVTGWLKTDQATKAGAQQRIAAYHGALNVAQEQIDKLSAKIASLESDAEVVAARAEETTRLNKFAHQRAETLRTAETPRRENARGGAVFETKVRNRGNDLADRLSGKLAEIDALEQKLAREVGNHDSMRAKIEAEIAQWEGKSVTEAKAALSAREKAAKAREDQKAAGNYKGKNERLSSADKAIDRAVKRIIESDRSLSEAELRSRSQEITDRILGSPDGRLPYDIHQGGPGVGGGGGEVRGSLNPREFAIPDSMIRDFLEHDVEQVVATHLRTIVPDVLLTERFGDVRMTEPLKRVTEEYAAKIDAATSEKKRTALAKERDAVIRDLAAVRDRIRGVYGWSPELRNMARVAQGAKAINNLTSMGSSAISSLPDLAGTVFRYGFTTTFAEGWSPMFKYLTGNLPEFEKFKTQMRAIGIGIDTATNSRQHALDDVMDVYKPQSRFERTLQGTSDKFFVANLLAPLTDIQKTVAAHVSTSEMLRAAKKAAAGSASERQIKNLAESGIDLQMASRIATQFEKGGEVIDGVHLPNTADWTDKGAARALNGAVAREVDIAVVTPGQEKPLWMSNPVLSLLGQFKSFTASSTERILIANLQRRDANVLSGLVASVTLGMMSYKINSLFGGQKTSDRPQDWVKEGISRGGVLGWFEEGNALASKMTRGGVDVYRMIGADKPLSRFASRSTLDMFLGPTAGKITGLSQVTGAAASMDWAESDTKALRRLFAFQNLWYVRGLLNQVEEGVNGKLGIQPR